MAARKPAASKTEWMSIGKLAKYAGISTRTIRYYEELGILPHPPRSEGNTRRYPPEYRFYLDGVNALKDIGFNLQELALLSQLYLGTGERPMSDAVRHETEQVIAAKLDSLRHRLAVLERLQKMFIEQLDSAPSSPAAGSGSTPLRKI